MTTATINPPRTSALYRAVWRWHFFAGLIVLPFVILIAVTGAIYLFKDEINNAAYAERRFVAPAETQALAPSEITGAALDAHPGSLVAYFPAPAPDRTAEVKIAGEDGLTDTIYVNPYDATVVASDWDAGPSGSTPMWLVRKLHSLEYVGWWGNRIIEAVAGWMVLLVATGIYLWWPRGRNVGVMAPRRTSGRPWWRDIHAVTGIYTAGFILFLALTGLPWSGVWGKYFYDFSYAAGLGMTDGYWSDLPTSDVSSGEAMQQTPWIMEHHGMPMSGGTDGVPAAIDDVVATVEAAGLHPGYELSMPSGPTGVFTASVYPHDISEERVIHLDQYTGEVLLDLGVSDLGTLGWMAEWGVSIHMGQQFGLANQIVLLLACIAMLVMAVSAIVMWWKRRPAGSLGAPAVPSDWRIPHAVLLMAIAAGLFFPLVGLSLLAVAAIEIGLHLVGNRRAV
ncbi:putative iron-regulated membrane protein [Palleronia aestuarii]|uniref:Putative iron-regulated membrane protein n=1 Tax=Palleronia aestuarii TaxID=568105 RepID=A0A2W7NBB0_9RHOB|nr:PepSY domain-containing protein [Palleronia aestuarii]PZX16923.1 putative iron-regulated membrane protein [Palleronia aestuarii]